MTPGETSQDKELHEALADAFVRIHGVRGPGVEMCDYLGRICDFLELLGPSDGACIVGMRRLRLGKAGGG